MASAQELYERVRDAAAGMPTSELDSETRRIWLLIGALSDALWRRANEPGFSIVNRFIQNAELYQPESEDEIAICNELTAPHNYPAVVRYVKLHEHKVGEYSERLHSAILESARYRWENEGKGREKQERGG
jgi:hypothetical protein